MTKASDMRKPSEGEAGRARGRPAGDGGNDEAATSALDGACQWPITSGITRKCRRHLPRSALPASRTIAESPYQSEERRPGTEVMDPGFSGKEAEHGCLLAVRPGPGHRGRGAVLAGPRRADRRARGDPARAAGHGGGLPARAPGDAPATRDRAVRVPATAGL